MLLASSSMILSHNRSLAPMRFSGAGGTSRTTGVQCAPEASCSSHVESDGHDLHACRKQKRHQRSSDDGSFEEASEGRTTKAVVVDEVEEVRTDLGLDERPSRRLVPFNLREDRRPH